MTITELMSTINNDMEAPSSDTLTRGRVLI